MEVNQDFVDNSELAEKGRSAIHTVLTRFVALIFQLKGANTKIMTNKSSLQAVGQYFCVTSKYGNKNLYSLISFQYK